MAELILDYITTLEGYGSSEGWPGWWGLQGPEYLAWIEQQEDTGHTVLMGATTYRLMSGMATAGEHGADEDDSMADLTAATKVVFSSTLEEPLAWPNSRLVRTDAVAEVRRMKEAGESMRTLGSVALSRSLLVAGLVDRLRVVVFPVVTGRSGSDRLYDGWPDVALTLLDSRTFDGRSQLLEYAPTVLDGPPSPG